jgi:hypothetical protein
MRATCAERSKEFASERRSQSWGDFHLISAAAIAARQADVQKIPGENYIVADAPHPPRLRLVEVRRIG